MRGLLLAVFAILAVVGPAASHPGRLDKQGCHHVRKDFVYKSGKVVRKGDYHCHRALIGQPVLLDGKEVLADPGDDQQDDEDDRPEDRSP